MSVTSACGRFIGLGARTMVIHPPYISLSWPTDFFLCRVKGLLVSVIKGYCSMRSDSFKAVLP